MNNLENRANGGKSFTLTVLVVAVLVVLVAAFFASPWPDGLERVAERMGFLHLGRTGLGQTIRLAPPIPDYQFPGFRNGRLATIVAGFVGTLVVCIIGLGLGRLMSAKRKNHT